MFENFQALQTGQQIGLLLALAVVIWCAARATWSAWREVSAMLEAPSPLDTPRDNISGGFLDVGDAARLFDDVPGLRDPLPAYRNMEGAAQARAYRKIVRGGE